MMDKLKIEVPPEQGKEIIDILKRSNSIGEEKGEAIYSLKVYRLPETVQNSMEVFSDYPLYPPLEVFKEGFEDNNLF
ncbi:MAG: hypothetical protein OWQ50_06095 [Acidianus infernus]|nr:hypothetical protein [Acidianus infernus]